jgi:hypothetical protein
MTNATKMEQMLKRYGGKLYSGTHKPGVGQCCILELVSICKGLEWTDDPEVVGMPDCREINDGAWSTPELRAKHMLRLAVAFEAWMDWPEERVRRFAERLVIRTVNVLIAELPHIGEGVARSCRAADTLEAALEAAAYAAAAALAAARAAAYAAEKAAAAWDAEVAVQAAAMAAAAAAEAAEDPDEVLVQAVDLWVEAAEWSGR